MKDEEDNSEIWIEGEFSMIFGFLFYRLFLAILLYFLQVNGDRSYA